jgi:hypothetical protein
MPSFRLTEFAGIIPRRAERLLPENAATIAANVELTSGEIRPIIQPRLIAEPTKGVRLETIYLADTIWLTWPFDVDVARSPLPGERRFFYTGDGEPRATTVALASDSGNNDYPSKARPLGLPAPQTAPTVTPTGGSVGETLSRRYTYTFYDDWNQESAPAPVSALVTGRTDDTWTLTNLDTHPSNGDSGTVAVAGGPGEEITTFTNAASALHWLRPGDQVYIIDTGASESTLVTVVSTPSPTTFTVRGDFTGADEWERVAKWGTIAEGLKLRIYRTAGTLAQFQLVAEITPAATYADTVLEVNILGDDLISGDWELPPTGLKGLLTLPSGSLAGFIENEVCFSEPFQPHAWPRRFRLRSDWTIVGMKEYQSGLVAGTTGKPLLIIGIEPEDMRAEPVNGVYPCLSKRSVVSLVDSVAFSTESGMVSIGDAGIQTVTSDWFTRNEWLKLQPNTILASVVRGKMFIVSRPGIQTTQKMFIIDYLFGSGLTTSLYTISAMYADPISGKLYVSCACTGGSFSGGFDIREWNPADGVFFPADWQSKFFVVDKQTNLGAFKVTFTARFTQQQIDDLQAAFAAAVAQNNNVISSGAVNGSINSYALNSTFLNGSDLKIISPPGIEFPGIDFTMYSGENNKLVYSRFITKSGRVYRLPSGFKNDSFKIRVQGQVVIHNVEIGQSPSALGRT